MKALQVSELGEPRDVLRVTEVTAPEPGPGQVVVRVLGGAVNFPDVLMVQGVHQLRPELPFTPGLEVSGHVVALGEGVSEFVVGQRVLGMTVFPFGGFAEYALMNVGLTFPAPVALDDAEAAALYVGYQTGWFGLHRRAGLSAGDTLLVHAAAGGVGSAAVQLGKAAGARVIGVVGGPNKAEAARELGADVVVDRQVEDFVEVVKAETDGRGADVIYDPVGGETYARSTKCIAFEGRILIIGFASGQIPTAQLNHALVKNYSILGLHQGLYNTNDPTAVRACHDALSDLAQRGQIRPLIGERVSFDGITEGMHSLADGHTVGRVVWTP